VLRLVAVLGYSDATTGALHPVCASRLRRAEVEVQQDDIMLFSGWARGRTSRPEAELMADAWESPGRVVLERTARSTIGNALAIARSARALDVDEVVLVTSGWHGRRASVLTRAALAGSRVKVGLATSDEPAALRARMRELVCWISVPFLALVAAGRGSVRR
jgi:hypothetical protein